MVRNKKIIIAIGGGGFTHTSDEDLDEYVVNQVNKSNINIGFLPTAAMIIKKRPIFFIKDLNHKNLNYLILISIQV